MSSDNVRAVLQDVSRRQLDAALAATQGRPQVADIYIYMSFPREAGFGLTETLYGDGKRVVEAYHLDQIVSPPVGSLDPDWQDSVINPVSAAYNDLAAAYTASGEECPTRIIVHYSVREEAIDADFSYNTILPDNGYPTDAFNAWFANAGKTGDFSADAMAEEA